jgi:predicted dehydrogenase
MLNEKPISRRNFLAGTSMAAAAFTLVPRHVLGGRGFKAPSDTLNIAGIGAWGKGRSDIGAMHEENLVALCDVDDTMIDKFMDQAKQDGNSDKYTNVKRYRDHRKMLDEMDKDIDAVTISTPDHNHAAIAMRAMQAGKHVFVQKPMTATVFEARKLMEAANKYGVMTQMGNQGHAGEGQYLINEWIWDGAIGGVHEVHCWTNRPIWPQGEDVKRPDETPEVPATLDWDLWLGPAPERPYNPCYHPFAWRGWWDFGTGALGDMGAHIIDCAYWPLKLKYPSVIEATSTPYNDESFPRASIVWYEFPAREGMPPVKMSWSDGGLTPQRPELIEEKRRMGDYGGGVLFIGDKGVLMCSTYGNNPRLVPDERMKAYKRELNEKGGPEIKLERSPGIHEEWIESCKTGKKSSTNFDYAAPLTETMMLGNVAIKLKDKNRKLHYDGEKMEFTNCPEGNEFLRREYRKGWTL